jgi:hypothetical protein
MRFAGLAWMLLPLLAWAPPSRDPWPALDVGDVAGARTALDGLPRPEDPAAAAAWMDARARVAWATGSCDVAFAHGVQAVAMSEAAGRAVPALTAALTPERPWMDPAYLLVLRAVPTGDAPAEHAALAEEILAMPAATTPEGTWLVWAARLLDPSVAAPPNEAPRENRPPSPARRRVALLRAMVEARHGDPRSLPRAIATLRAVERENGPAAPLALWFEGEAMSRQGQAREAALRFVRAAVGCDDAPWVRVAALRRASGLLQEIDPQESLRLEAAARKEMP